MDYNNKVMQVIPLMSAQGVFERRIWPTDELMGWGWEVCSNKECAVRYFSKKKIIIIIAWSLWPLVSNVENFMFPVTKRRLTCSVAKLGLLFATPWVQHTKLPCPSLSPRVCSNSCTLSLWYHPTMVAPFSSCPQSFPASGSFPVSQLFTSGGQSIGAWASTIVLPMNS